MRDNNCVIPHHIEIYSLDSVIHLSNNWGQVIRTTSYSGSTIIFTWMLVGRDLLFRSSLFLTSSSQNGATHISTLQGTWPRIVA